MAKKPKQQSEMEIRWKKGCRFTEASVPVEKAYAELCKIKDANGGQLTAEDVVVYAEGHARSSMHKLIGMDDGWDDARCAHRYRVMRAGTILRSIEVRYTKEQKEPTRAFNVDASKWKKEDSAYKPYRGTDDILQDETARAALLQRALNELIAFQRRYRALNELAVLVREIDEFMDSFHAANA
ncbi:hypothetical protein [Petrachloros mirabilis]